ncbi:3-hydroxybutyryl-CoA dehydratase [Myxococcus xanthus DK 1622]|uniref:3-hydroxybutyryl-CoA dehydratase n=1 Tax=Myxococcus xanthus (strain DK1622) TaxID=246197 RepID=Q1D5U2_MYXXD|nr:MULTISPECIES: enoyl-CoA hydratase-related protein [Myxococcus]ABF89228.1 3-hydroxybutyryl-CoA dehydratase [Myxococcus xanthus DK 1622]NOJ56034.1 enoyl-CoA hydratase/isomerase family protein [Myxococcus xanthus]QDE97677.1 enoyl-CoA hydratase [Myxococcus xanthus]QPM76425.1 enoyl-CoA hydratase/isomerase family protein [Myxococcus xanthus]QVW65487.1 enoyl-CoA hydratase/isomerase family protein [Myxococcus xanthus DZ2]
MAYENIRLEQEGAIATLFIDRPKALNALNTKTLQELESALKSLPADVRVLIVTGGGEKAFVAGADIAEMAALTDAQAQEFGALGHRVMAALEALPIPTIAAVNGFALGGGSELALACDFIYASEKAKLGLPEVGLGVIPGFGGTQRLTRVVGRARAKELIFTGDRIDAAKAKEIGMVLEVLPADGLLAHCRAVAEKIVKNSPLAISKAKQVIEAGADQDLRAANDIERKAFGDLFGSEDQREGMKAFLEKRPATFTGK